MTWYQQQLTSPSILPRGFKAAIKAFSLFELAHNCQNLVFTTIHDHTKNQKKKTGETEKTWKLERATRRRWVETCIRWRLKLSQGYNTILRNKNYRVSATTHFSFNSASRLVFELEHNCQNLVFTCLPPLSIILFYWNKIWMVLNLARGVPPLAQI